MPKINQKILNAAPIPIPDEETRLGIIKKLDATLACAEVLARRTGASTSRPHLIDGCLPRDRPQAEPF